MVCCCSCLRRTRERILVNGVLLQMSQVNLREDLSKWCAVVAVSGKLERGS